MSEEEKAITIVLDQKGENITTRHIFISEKENITTYTPATDVVIMRVLNDEYKKTGQIPKEFNFEKKLTDQVIQKVADEMEKVDDVVKGQTEDKKMEKAVDALIQQQPSPALREAQLAKEQGISDPARTIIQGPHNVGGYRVTKRRRNPRRKQKKSYRRRRV